MGCECVGGKLGTAIEEINSKTEWARKERDGADALPRRGSLSDDSLPWTTTLSQASPQTLDQSALVSCTSHLISFYLFSLKHTYFSVLRMTSTQQSHVGRSSGKPHTPGPSVPSTPHLALILLNLYYT